MDRRSLLKSAAVIIAAQRLPGWSGSAAAEGAAPAWRHGVSKFGALKYSAGFAQFDYVNAKAPKGGSASQIALGTFDNFNPVVAGVKGNLAPSMDLLYDTLFVQSLDEVASVYGLLAEAVSYPGRFLLRHLSPARRGEMERRQAGDAGRRHLLLRSLQEAQPAGGGELPPGRQGREER